MVKIELMEGRRLQLGPVGVEVIGHHHDGGSLTLSSRACV